MVLGFPVALASSRQPSIRACPATGDASRCCCPPARRPWLQSAVSGLSPGVGALTSAAVYPQGGKALPQTDLTVQFDWEPSKPLPFGCGYTTTILGEVQAWRNRPLDEEYYVIYLDSTFVSIRRGKTAKEPVYVALGVKPDGRREILGFWVFGSEGETSRNWEQVLRELRERGVRKVRLFVTDDLPGIEEAIRRVFPGAEWQLCVLHAVRGSLAQVSKKDREELAQDLKAIYRAESRSKAEQALRALRERWGERYPKLVWERKAEALLRFLDHPKELRPYLYTTNQLERLMKEVKRRTRVVGVFCGETAVEKLL